MEYNAKGYSSSVRRTDKEESVLADENEYKGSTISGNWEFEAIVNGSNILSNTNIYVLNKEIAIKDDNIGVDGVMTIEEVRISPVSVKIIRSFKSNKSLHDNSTYSIGLEVKDEK